MSVLEGCPGGGKPRTRRVFCVKQVRQCASHSHHAEPFSVVSLALVLPRIHCYPGAAHDTENFRTVAHAHSLIKTEPLNENTK